MVLAFTNFKTHGKILKKNSRYIYNFHVFTIIHFLKILV